MQYALSLIALSAAVMATDIVADMENFWEASKVTAWPTYAGAWDSIATNCPEESKSQASYAWSSWAHTASYEGPCPFETAPVTLTSYVHPTPTSYAASTTPAVPVYYSSSTPKPTPSTTCTTTTLTPVVSPSKYYSSSAPVVSPSKYSSVAPPPVVYSSASPVWTSYAQPKPSTTVVYSSASPKPSPSQYRGAASQLQVGGAVVAVAAGVAALL